MFENVGKEIKEDLNGIVFASTLLWGLGAAVVSYLIYEWGGMDGASAFILGVFVTLIVGGVGYLRARRKVMYHYAYAELVETVQKIQKHLEKDGREEKPSEVYSNVWKCPECGEMNNEYHRFCAHCGGLQPKL